MQRVAIITGGGKGIGRAIGIRFAAQGIHVSLWDRNHESVKATANEILSNGGRAIFSTGDCTDPEFIKSSLEYTNIDLGSVGILVNNAGLDVHRPFLDIDDSEVYEVLRCNIRAPILCIKQCLPSMIENQWGRIINISSISAQNGGARMAHYAASKSAVVGLTKALAVEFAKKQITVNCVSPGMIDTPMLQRSPFDIASAVARIPISRLGRPEEVAEACAYLTHDEAAYVTGQTININGGQYF